MTENEEKHLTAATAEDGRRTVLLFQNGERERMAIDLSLVARLEEFPSDTIEMAGDQEVVQYRGHIMPVFRIATVLGSETKSAVSSGRLQVVVYTENGHSG